MGIPSSSDASVWGLFGAIMRLEREKAGMTLRPLAAAIPTDFSHLGKWERGQHRPPRDAVSKIDSILDANGRLTKLHAYLSELTELRTCSVTSAISVSDGDMDAIRRQLLSGLVALGTVGPATDLLGGLDSLRNLVDARVGTSQLAEWEELAWEYALTVRSRTDIIADLSQDLLAVQRLAMAAPAAEARGWERVNARMTMLLAYALGNAGNERESRRWWASARRSAARADEGDLLAAVNAVEAIQALYEQRPLPLIQTRIDAALTAAQGRPCRGTASAYGAQAHIAAMSGDRASALAALAEQARIAEQLPDEVVRDELSVFGWPEARLLHTRSLVLTLLNDLGADGAQEEAVQAYPSAQPRPAALARQVAQVQMHRAITAVRRGDVAEGISMAQAALGGLPVDGRTRYIRYVAGAVLESVPAVDRARPPAVEYKEYLQLPPGERT
ncbi:helix-turn-helix domain-containing protein [Actinomadura sp. ATCC 31491]|uniref:Helix-turn-helix domain-containing protein n=1 Tax=Actinomadura luzonensis TaxID=2805427 RepID=A0ABT0G5M2_9ACTN|nr:helix-turn-helix transcriptional regulator [Actinomadura luzonensis]MCK2219678.1 helix-turn-helix domain-containing protein [Actinomadura luzonensis]